MKLARRAAWVAATAVAFTFAACQPRSSAPPDIAKLERDVSLQLAHIRDVGPTDSGQRRKLSDAADLEREGERAIAAQNWRTAESKLLQAQAILRQLEP